MPDHAGSTHQPSMNASLSGAYGQSRPRSPLLIKAAEREPGALGLNCGYAADSTLSHPRKCDQTAFVSRTDLNFLCGSPIDHEATRRIQDPLRPLRRRHPHLRRHLRQ